MDGENNGKPYEQMDDLGGKPHHFRKHPYKSLISSFGLQNLVQKIRGRWSILTSIFLKRGWFNHQLDYQHQNHPLISVPLTTPRSWVDWQNWCQAHPAASSSSPQAWMDLDRLLMIIYWHTENMKMTSNEYILFNATRSNYDELAYNQRKFRWETSETTSLAGWNFSGARSWQLVNRNSDFMFEFWRKQTWIFSSINLVGWQIEVHSKLLKEDPAC